jgi:hypothetical protein
MKRAQAFYFRKINHLNINLPLLKRCFDNSVEQIICNPTFCFSKSEITTSYDYHKLLQHQHPSVSNIKNIFYKLGDIKTVLFIYKCFWRCLIFTSKSKSFTKLRFSQFIVWLKCSSLFVTTFEAKAKHCNIETCGWFHKHFMCVS